MLKQLLFSSLLMVMASIAHAQSTEPTLYCRIDLPNRPLTFVKYYAEEHTAWVQSGFPATWIEYTDVIEVTGLPPYGDKGTSLVAFGGDVPIIHFKKTGAGKIWYTLREETYPFSATWGSLPAAKAKSPGVCWTPDMQPEQIHFD
jgi:hypothetical protein